MSKPRNPQWMVSEEQGLPRCPSQSGVELACGVWPRSGAELCCWLEAICAGLELPAPSQQVTERRFACDRCLLTADLVWSWVTAPNPSVSWEALSCSRFSAASLSLCSSFVHCFGRFSPTFQFYCIVFVVFRRRWQDSFQAEEIGLLCECGSAQVRRSSVLRGFPPEGGLLILGLRTEAGGTDVFSWEHWRYYSGSSLSLFIYLHIFFSFSIELISA